MQTTPDDPDETTLPDGPNASPNPDGPTDTAPSAARCPHHPGVVVTDRHGERRWHETYARSAGLQALAAELAARHTHAPELLADLFHAAYQRSPQLRAPTELAPWQRVHHHLLDALLASPESTALRREATGDAYAAALTVLAQASTVRELLDRRTQDRAEQPRLAPDAAVHPADVAARPASDDATSTASADPDAPPESAGPPPTHTPRTSTASTAPTAAAAAAPGTSAGAPHAAAARARSARQQSAALRSWGFAPGALERLPHAERDRLAERLRTGRLAHWAELIGRFRRLARGERARRVAQASGELVGVTVGDDLSRLVPSELTALGLPQLRAVFAARYAAGELMLYESRGEEPTGRGAIIACVDTSHSMYAAGPDGVSREAWAKACALALLDQARADGRDFVGILFSAAGQLSIHRFPADQPADLAGTLDFAECFLGGGTSYQSPLSAAAELLGAEFDDTARARGDIVLLTDDECEVTAEWLRNWRETKRRLGFRLFGVAVGAPRAAAHDSVLATLTDNLRTVTDLTDAHTGADLFRLI